MKLNGKIMDFFLLHLIFSDLSFRLIINKINRLKRNGILNSGTEAEMLCGFDKNICVRFISSFVKLKIVFFMVK